MQGWESISGLHFFEKKLKCNSFQNGNGQMPTSWGMMTPVLNNAQYLFLCWRLRNDTTAVESPVQHGTAAALKKMKKASSTKIE